MDLQPELAGQLGSSTMVKFNSSGPNTRPSSRLCSGSNSCRSMARHSNHKGAGLQEYSQLE